MENAFYPIKNPKKIKIDWRQIKITKREVCQIFSKIDGENNSVVDLYAINQPVDLALGNVKGL